MLKRQIEIINKLGLHARAAAKLVSAANRFQSEIYVENNKQSVNGKSIMGVMMLAAGRGSLLTLHIDGDDAEDAMDTLCDMISSRFGEAE